MDIQKAIQPSEPFDNETEYEVEIDAAPASDGIPSEVGGEDQSPHTANLASLLDESALRTLGSDLIEQFNADQTTRAEWLQVYTDGLDYLGFNPKDRTAPFKGASGVFHPILSEAVVRFQSNAITEIFPAAGPVLTKILGDETPDRVKQAARIKEELNYQLTEKMCEFRPEMEKLLFRLPLAGSVFKKNYFDPLNKRPCSMMVPAEDFVVDYNATDLASCERYTHVMKRSKNSLKKLMRAGFYRSIDLTEPPPEEGEGKEKENELTGLTFIS